jgi:hypothetical protein
MWADFLYFLYVVFGSVWKNLAGARRHRNGWNMHRLFVVYPSQYHPPFSAFSVHFHITLHPPDDDVDVTLFKIPNAVFFK